MRGAIIELFSRFFLQFRHAKISGNMARQVYTIKQILVDLNNGLDDKPWVPAEQLLSIPTAKINVQSNTVDPAGAAIALKGFINVKTGELRTFVAKWLDEPEANKLP